MVVCALAAGCGSGLRMAPVGPHETSGPPPIVIDAPPPPAKVESVPPDPGGSCAWLDGHWEWGDGAWEWTAGQWLVPPARCHFATPEALWVPATGRGLLFYLRGRWYPDSPGPACVEPRPCGAEPNGADPAH
jgi:hypothetical protein